MTQVGEAFVSVKADTRGFETEIQKGVKVGLDAASAEVDRFERDTRAQMERLASSLSAAGEKMSQVGKQMTMKVTLPIVGLGTAIFKAAGDFEASMNKVMAISGATGDEFEALSNQAKELGATTRFSASQSADAMSFLAMAGFQATDIIGAMPSVLQLAAAANLDIASSADIASNILSGFALETEQLAAVNDALVKTMTRTNTDLQQLGQAMKYVGPIAQAAGVGINETAAAIGLLGNAGIQGSMAGTTLRGAISNLLNVSGPAADTIERLGLNTRDSSGNFIGFVSVIEQLEAAGASADDMLQIFGDRAGPGMAALLSQGSEALSNLITELDNSGGIAQEIADVQMRGLNGAMLELKSAIEGLFIAIAESGLLEAFTNIIKQITGFVSSLAGANPTIFKFVGVIAGIAAVTGPVLMVLGKLTTMIAGTINVALGASAALSTFIATASTAQLAMGGLGLALGAAAGLFLLLRNKAEETAPYMQKVADDAQRLSDILAKGGDITPTLITELTDLANESPVLRDALIQAGLGLEDLAAKIEEGINPALNMEYALKRAAVEAGYTAEEANVLTNDLVYLAISLRQAQEKAAQMAQILPEVTDNQDDLARASLEAAFALDEQARAAAADAKALNDLLNATINAFRSQFDFERMLGEVARAFLDYRTAVTEGTVAGQELLDLQDKLTLSALDVADAAIRTAEQMAAAQGTTLDAAQSARIYVEELRRFAQALSPNDPVRRNLEALIRTIETRLPTSITITVDADVRPAMSALDSLVRRSNSSWEDVVYSGQTAFEALARPAEDAGRNAGRGFGSGAASGIRDATPEVVQSAEQLVSQMNSAMERAMESFQQAVDAQLKAAQDAFTAAWSAIDARNAQEAATRRLIDAERALGDAHARVAQLIGDVAAAEGAIVVARNDLTRLSQSVTQAESALADALRQSQAAALDTEAATASLTRAQNEAADAKARVKAASDALKAAAEGEKVANQQLAAAQKALDTAKRRRDLAGVLKATEAVADAEAEVARRQALSTEAADEVAAANAHQEATADALVDAQGALRAAKDADKVASDALREAQRALTQAQRDAEQGSRALAAAEQNLIKVKNDLANAERSVTSATQALRDANLALLKVSQDLLDQGPEAEANFRRIATAAGLEKAEIDKLVSGYRELETARRNAAAAAEAQIKFERELGQTKGAAAIDASVKALQNKMWEIQQMPRGADSSAAQRQAATLAVTAAEAYADAAAGRGTPAWNNVFRDSLGYFLNAYPMLSDELAGIRRAIGLANGAIVTSPTLAQIGENSRPEAVIPLTRPRRALELMEQSGLADLARQAGAGGGSLITMHGVTIAGPTDADLVAQRVNAAVRSRLVL